MYGHHKRKEVSLASFALTHFDKKDSEAGLVILATHMIEINSRGISQSACL